MFQIKLIHCKLPPEFTSMISTQTIFCKYWRCAPFRKFTSDSTATVRMRSGDNAEREVLPKTLNR